jgi:TonB family protein
MNAAVTDVIVARSRDTEAASSTMFWSVLLHAAVIGVALLLPNRATEEAPRTVMTISLGGVAGPRTGGLTQIGGRAVQAPPPPTPVVRQPQTAPAPKPPAMTLPDPRARTRPQPKPDQAPPDATGRTPTTGEQPREGSARAETGARGQGFGLSSGGGGIGGVTLDVSDFCCPEYLTDMVLRIQRNWDQKQGLVGSTMMKFTIQRDGTLQAVQIERPSGFLALDNSAQRALLLTRQLPPLPAPFPNPTLTVLLRFDYQR